ncbi:hypothetical protein H4R20_001808 [Coemansia guatemalensis]|uniref:polynucleotide adenylyltransferase n=1 Tax=Coemansia guatemalensis TaxID=2761395 RepID=A0A9W8HWR7_9FUNG|nr:hypothetical protein H4R20_001808 [Coemansia guatemalensis]
MQSLGSTAQEREAARLDVADKIIKHRLVEDGDRVLAVAVPADAKLEAKAAAITDTAAQAMERLRNADRAVDEAFAGDTAELDSELQKYMPSIRSWTTKRSGASTPPRESLIYGFFDDFVLFVACCVRSGLSSQGLASSRLILPGNKRDFKPVDAEDAERVDVVLGACDIDTPVAAQAIERYAHMFCIVEVKRSGGFKTALPQLLVYSRNLYAWQGHRRYLWGLTVCDAEVCAYVMLNDTVHVSSAMDVTTADGRLSLIILLVRWSLCLEDQLGYDSTIRRIGDSDHYEIDCTDDEDSDSVVHTYVTSMCLKSADSIIGRHTRCFVANPKVADGPDGTSDNSSSTEVVIKDAWSPAPHESDLMLDPRSEILLMRSITQNLKGKVHDLVYPKLLLGGHAQLRRRHVSVPDTTAAILGPRDSTAAQDDDGTADDNNLDKMVFRAHRCIVMEPRGYHIKTVSSDAELVIVLADAMKCHSAILDHCNILHRDLSTNNILVVRKDGEALPRGLLIDFDYAIEVDSEQRAARPARSGTLPFMSVNNLINADTPRTALDDWESLLYIICWLASSGICSEDRVDTQDFARKPIHRWRQAGVKRFPSISGVLLTNRGKELFNSNKYMPTSYQLMDRLRTLLLKDGKQQKVAGSKIKLKALPLASALPHLNMLDADKEPLNVEKICKLIRMLSNLPYKPIILARLRTDAKGTVSLILGNDADDNGSSTYSWAVTYSTWAQKRGNAAASKKLPSLQPKFLPLFASIATTQLPHILPRQEELNRELEELSRLWTPDEASVNAVSAVQKLIYSAVQKIDKNVRTRLEMFGSRRYGICQSDSDFDFLMTMMDRKMLIDKVRERFISQFKGALRKSKGIPYAIYIPKARVPIIKFAFRRGNRLYNGDISFNDRSAIFRSNMLRAYIKMDPRVRIVLMLLKQWGIRREITSKDVLNSYCVTMMGLTFLISQRVIPPLQLLATTVIDDRAWDRLSEIHKSPEEISKLYTAQGTSNESGKMSSTAQCLQTGHRLPGVDINGSNGYYLGDSEMLQVWKSPNEKSAFELTFEMFRYYGTEFDPKIHAISPRLGSPCVLRSSLTKLDAPLPNSASLQSTELPKGTQLLAIEDPLVLSANSGRKASVQWVAGLLWEMRRAAWAMTKGLEDERFGVLDRLFLPPTAEIYTDAGIWASAYKQLIPDIPDTTGDTFSDVVSSSENYSTISLEELEDQELVRLSETHGEPL